MRKLKSFASIEKAVNIHYLSGNSSLLPEVRKLSIYISYEETQVFSLNLESSQYTLVMRKPKSFDSFEKAV